MRTKIQHPLSDRHFEEVRKMPRWLKRAVADFWALSWRPGDYSGSFLGKNFIPFGRSMLVSQWSWFDDDKQSIPFRGYRGQLNPATSEVVYSTDGQVTDHDLGFRPFPGARGRILDPVRGTALVELGLDMYGACKLYASRNFQGDAVPQLPTTFLGFAPHEPPPFEDTPVLRRRVADHMGWDVEQIDVMDEQERMLLLRAEWPSTHVLPEQRGNDTGHLLISQQLCTRVRQSLRTYESFEGLLGVELPNPMARMQGRVPNPARAVLAEMQIEPLDLQALPAETPEELEAVTQKFDSIEKAMRQAIGPQSAVLSRESIYDGLVDFDEPLKLDAQDVFGAASADERVATLRQLVPESLRDGVSDTDLLLAADRPTERLTASGLCRIQVLAYDDSPAVAEYGAFRFDPETLGRDRTYFDLTPKQAS